MSRQNTVVVTGITSFVGYHLARHFSREGFLVIGTSTGAAKPRDGIEALRLTKLADSSVISASLDITKSDELTSFIAKYKPDFWIHHAGWTKDYRSPLFDSGRAYSINVAPLATVYESLKKTDCRGVIVTGTDGEYGNSNEIHREDEACMPLTPYGLSKLSETIRSYQLSLQHGIPTRVARLFIPYGPLDAPWKMISSAVKALREKRVIDLSSCEQSRDFLYIDDVVCGYMALIRDMEEHSDMFDIFNICSGKAATLKQLLLSIAGALSSDRALLSFGALEQRALEAPVCYGDNSKALQRLKWKPSPIEEGISRFLSLPEELR